ncbi:MAG: hypothetical protein H6709_06670 [Kofleriaceae bacterium]|nr:hypothetical protein [Myxococcales bacterium]MCB9560311.1 hypothetical protein [Kofleriaceae bacterium]MCB9571759.1 hypothetical protein [Kofleriaceae bacterium]
MSDVPVNEPAPSWRICGLFGAPMPTVAGAVSGVFAERDNYEIGLAGMSFDEVATGGLPGDRPSVGAFFTSCRRRDGVVMLTNQQDGWFTLCNVLARRLDGCHLRLASSNLPGSQVQSLTVWDDRAEIRHVHVLQDDARWDFMQSGTPLPWENVEKYRSRAKRDRLSREMLIGYANALGWPIDADGFWSADGDALWVREKRPVPGSRC